MPESPQAKPNAFFTRYEIVAVAIPGGVFLFGLFLVLRPWGLGLLANDRVPDVARVDLGTLGLFTVAAFCAGQVIQAMSAGLEIAMQWVLGKVYPKYRTTAQRDVMPKFLQDPFSARLTALGVSDPDSLSRFEYRDRVFPYILARLYRAGVTDRLLDMRVSSGLHRALALTFLALGVLLNAFPSRFSILPIVMYGGAVVMVLMTNRYRRQFYDQGTFEYVGLDDTPA